MLYRVRTRTKGRSIAGIPRRKTPKKQTVLFLCVYNSVRSQIAEGLMRSLYGDRFDAYSAGIAPAGVHPLAIRTMREIGVDLTGQRSKSVCELPRRRFKYIVTFSSEIQGILGPRMPHGKISIHCPVKSPSDIYAEENEALADFRKLRNRIQELLRQTFGKVPSSQER